MKITHQSVVSMDYTLKNKDGAVIDTSEGKTPLVFMYGSNQIISGLERELESLQSGDSKDVVVDPADAYGVRRDDLLDKVSITQFPDPEQVKVGAQFNAGTSQGERVCTVIDVAAEDVTLDFNHPLAGETLYFQVKIVDVREATADELAHGHVHSPNCQHGH